MTTDTLFLNNYSLHIISVLTHVFFLAFSLEVVVAFVHISCILDQHALKLLFDNSVRYSELTVMQIRCQ
jgi:hypothetical protein